MYTLSSWSGPQTHALFCTLRATELSLPIHFLVLSLLHPAFQLPQSVPEVKIFESKNVRGERDLKNHLIQPPPLMTFSLQSLLAFLQRRRAHYLLWQSLPTLDNNQNLSSYGFHFLVFMSKLVSQHVYLEQCLAHISTKDFSLVLLAMVILVLLTVITSITPFSYNRPSCLKERIISLGASLRLLHIPSSINPYCHSVISWPFPPSSRSPSRCRQVSNRFDASLKTPAPKTGHKTSHMGHQDREDSHLL